MADLPPHIMEDILLRSPVKSLLRWRCVCKEWRDIISHPQFAKIHLRHPQTQARTRLCIIAHYEEPGDMIARLSTTERDDNGELVLRYDCLTDVNRSLNLTYNAHFLDSCDGLFCLVDSSHNVFLWSPSTRQHNQLPRDPYISKYDFSGYDSSTSRDDYTCYGFGYDSCTDDYKIVGAFLLNDYSDIRIHVFSLKSYAWRRILPGKHYAYGRIECHENGVVLHGALHWVVSYFQDEDHCATILAFDLEKEQLREMTTPINNSVCVRLKVIEGCLCAYDAIKDPIEKWVMKKYGVEASWTKMAFPYACRNGNNLNEDEEFKCQLTEFLNNQHLLFINNVKVVLWDDKEDTENILMSYEDWWFCLSRFFVETLVSPHPSLQSMIKEGKKKKKKKKKKRKKE